jgi:hypothetical protein
VAKEQVQDLRLVALSVADGGRATWRIGARDAAAIKQYRDAGWTDWRQHIATGGGDPGKPPPQYTSFPRAADVFDVTIDGAVVRAKHAGSGAVFVVDTAAAQSPAPKKSKARR